MNKVVLAAAALLAITFRRVEFWDQGVCGRCGRKLTVPASIESGIGPECAGKVRGFRAEAA